MTEGYRDLFLTANGIRVHYLEWGDPKTQPIILLHGTGSNAHSWDRVCSVLARAYRCIALDCRDHGDTDRSPEPMNRDTLVEDVEGAVEELGLSKFGLIGLSMGGRTAMLYAGQHPERLERLVIEDMGPETPAATTARVMAIFSSTPKVYESLDHYVEFARGAKPYASEEWLRELGRLSLRELPDGRLENKYHGPRQQAPLTTSVDLWEHIAKITCPTLIIRGEDSDVLTDEIATRMVGKISRSRVVVVPRAWHVVHEDNPQDAIAAYAEFFGVAVP